MEPRGALAGVSAHDIGCLQARTLCYAQKRATSLLCLLMLGDVLMPWRGAIEGTVVFTHDRCPSASWSKLFYFIIIYFFIRILYLYLYLYYIFQST